LIGENGKLSKDDILKIQKERIKQGIIYIYILIYFKIPLLKKLFPILKNYYKRIKEMVIAF